MNVPGGNLQSGGPFKANSSIIFRSQHNKDLRHFQHHLLSSKLTNSKLLTRIIVNNFLTLDEFYWYTRLSEIKMRIFRSMTTFTDLGLLGKR